MTLLYPKLAFIITTLMIGTMGLSAPSYADDASNTLFFTIFAEDDPGDNVRSVEFDWTGGVFTLQPNVEITSTSDADGIVVNPQDLTKLIVGTASDQTLDVVTIADGTIVSTATPVNPFHLELIDDSTIVGTGIPGAMSIHTINGDGSLNAGALVTILGDDVLITQLITLPVGFLYTSSNFLGNGNYGTLEFTGINEVTTTQVDSDFCGAHGGEYDALSGTVFIAGENCIVQLSTAGAELCSLTGGVDFTLPAGFDHFDQLVVDGEGHLLIADNGGNLFLVDYASAPGFDLCHASVVVASEFLVDHLDDIAPLVMPPDDGDEGCTPGYYKNMKHFDSWIGFSPDDLVGAVFSDATSETEGKTLLQALKFKGGKDAEGAERILLRAAVAAVLNAANPDVDYPNSVGSIVTDVNNAILSGDRGTMLNLKDGLDADNNLGCPLN